MSDVRHVDLLLARFSIFILSLTCGVVSRKSGHVNHRLTDCIPKDTVSFVIEIRQTDQYARWFKKLKDPRAKAKIDIRIRRLSLGNPGDAEPIGKGLSELRIDYGPGYRIYFMKRGEEYVLLLAGGDKSSQQRDIKQAHELAENM